MATWQAPNVTTYGYTPPGTGHGEAGITQHLHAKVYLPATFAANDTLQFGYLPPNAIVTGVTLVADSQLDSNGSPTLAFDVGITGTTQLWKAAVTTVGHSAGVSGDTTMASAGMLFKTTAKTLVVGTIHTGAATAVAGAVEIDVSYFVEDTPGSPA